ncbi:bifunctional diaminohydroxyphosphoribosylaminopyrimidine deaminase/5-amino-6-(5-phosphoribosylamino)uracil reductase RibD [Candidatus Omnitrophota bacterium]
MNKHEFFMRKALELAGEGRGSSSPNPMVGAIVVKNGRIISSAYHKRPGSLHAEAIALRKAGAKAKGATLYVNLEPCRHIGRTPPCTDAIIKSKIRKVYCAMRDPNLLNNGRGIEALKKNKINVSVGLLRDEALKLNKVFVKYVTKKMPFVTLKMAESLDGKIATRSRDSKWITSDVARSYGHRLRSQVDAILVGVNTILKDDPLLTSRKARSPIKVVLDPDLKISERAKIFSKRSPSLSIVVILKRSLSEKSFIEKIKRLSKKGVLVLACPGNNGRIDLKALLKELAELEIAHLLVEGGGNTAAGFIEKGLVDKVFFFIAPKIIGGRDAITSIEGLGVYRVKKAIVLKDMDVERIGSDILVKANVHRNN